MICLRFAAAACSALFAVDAYALEIEISPKDRLWTEDVEVLVTGAEPGAEVVLTATLTDENGVDWSSKGVFFADSSGTVDLSRAASIAGTYRGVDPHGPFWSLLPVRVDRVDGLSAGDLPPTAPRAPRLDPAAPAAITLRAADGGTESASIATLRSVDPAVTIRKVSEADLRGLYFEPGDEGPHAAVLVVTGSGGGVNFRAAGALASKGFAVLALAHFGYEGRPDELTNIPLEYFETAIKWLQAETGVDRVGLLGDSRGGEGVLLIASIFPDLVGAVSAGVPSNVVWGGCCTASAVREPAWTLNDAPLDFSPYPFDEGRWGFEFLADKVGFRDFYLPGMMASGDDNPATIRVENIKAPVMLQSGAADLMWPSSIAAERIANRLKANDFPHPVENHIYAAAGHGATFGAPVTSRTPEVTHPVTGTVMYLGGDPAANARAGRMTFKRAAEFFATYLEAGDR